MVDMQMIYRTVQAFKLAQNRHAEDWKKECGGMSLDSRFVVSGHRESRPSKIIHLTRNIIVLED